MDEKNDDLISRQDAINAVNQYGSIWMEYTDSMTKEEIAEEALKASKRSMVNILHDLPSAQRKGKWIYEGIRGRFPVCKCSVCGSYENADWAIMQGADYCPHCGARMEEN